MMRTVAILGASAERSKFGNKAVRAYLSRGFRVFPINPKESEIEGLSVFRNLSELPERPSLISVYLPPAVFLKVLPQISPNNCDELWLNPGSDSPEVVAATERTGLKIVRACSIVGIGVCPSTL